MCLEFLLVECRLSPFSIHLVVIFAHQLVVNLKSSIGRQLAKSSNYLIIQKLDWDGNLVLIRHSYCWGAVRFCGWGQVNDVSMKLRLGFCIFSVLEFEKFVGSCRWGYLCGGCMIPAHLDGGCTGGYVSDLL